LGPYLALLSYSAFGLFWKQLMAKFGLFWFFNLATLIVSIDGPQLIRLKTREKVDPMFRRGKKQYFCISCSYYFL